MCYQQPLLTSSVSHDPLYLYADYLLLKKHFLILSVLKAVVSLNSLCKLIWLGFFDVHKNSIYLVFTALQNKKNLTDPKLLSNNVFISILI